MNKVFYVEVKKSLVIQASSHHEAKEKALHYCDSDSQILCANYITPTTSDLPYGLSRNDEPDNSIGMTINDILKEDSCTSA